MTVTPQIPALNGFSPLGVSLPKLPADARHALRNAIRSHAGWGDIAVGRRINDLSKADLFSAARVLNIDVAPYTRLAAEHGDTSLGTETPEETAAVDAVIAEWKDAGGRGVDNSLTQAEREIDAIKEAQAPAFQAAGIDAEVKALRRELGQSMVEGDFEALTARLTQLVTEASKPAVVETKVIQVEVERPVDREVRVYVNAPADANVIETVAVAPRPAPAVTGQSTWHDLFSVSGELGNRRAFIYAPSPATPAIDQKYIWPESVTAAALCAMSRNRHVWLYGPAGTGKSTFAEQIAARTGRPFVLIACDDTTEAAELVGMTVPHKGSVRWQDGVLTAAMRTPHAIVLIDEITVARAGAVMVFQSVLTSGYLTIKETGETVRCAEGVRFIVADNTNGTGGGANEGYEGTRILNRATRDRFSAFLRIDYMAADVEAHVLVSRSGCTPELASVLVECAAMTRRTRNTQAIGLRRLVAWAEALTDGQDVRESFEHTILNACASEDREPTEQCCALGLNKRNVAQAVKGIKPTEPTLSPARSSQANAAATDFADADDDNAS